VKKLKEITIDVAAEAIRARKNDNSKTLVIPIEKIQEAVGAFYGVSVKEIKGSIHAYEKIKSMVDTDDNLRLEIQSIKKKLN